MLHILALYYQKLIWNSETKLNLILNFTIHIKNKLVIGLFLIYVAMKYNDAVIKI